MHEYMDMEENSVSQSRSLTANSGSENKEEGVSPLPDLKRPTGV